MAVVEMAPKRAMKGRSPSPKRGRKNPVTEKVNILVEAFGDTEQVGLVESLPANARKMLGKAVESTLGKGAASDERHEYQTKMAGAIGEILKKCVVDVWEPKVAEGKKDVDAVEATKNAAMTTLDSAEQKLSQMSGKRGDAATLLDEAETAHKDAAKKLSEAQDAVDALEVQQMKKTAERTKCFNVLDQNYKSLKTASGDGGGAFEAAEKKYMGGLKSMLTSLAVDGSLLGAIGLALEKKAEERGGFDAMVVEKVEETLQKHLADLDDFLNNFEKIKGEKEAAVVSAQAALDAAAEQEKSCQEGLATAKANETAAEDEVKTCQDDVAGKEKELAKANAEFSEKEDALALAKENLAAFEFLSERVAAVPEPPPAEEPAAPAAE